MGTKPLSVLKTDCWYALPSTRFDLLSNFSADGLLKRRLCHHGDLNQPGVTMIEMIASDKGT